MRLKYALVVVSLFLYTGIPYGAYSRLAEWEERFQHDARGNTLPYRLFVPDTTDPTAGYPLLLVLHGATELGTDNTIQLDWTGNHMWEV